MSVLFSPVDLGGVTLPNRIVVSPMCQYAAIDGSAQPWHQVHYGMLAMSGAACCASRRRTSSATAASPRAALGMYSDENEAALKPVVDWARGWMPNVKLGIQLGHAGRKASAQRPWKGGGPLTQADAPDLPWTTFSASAIPFDTKWHTPVALDAVGLKRVKQAFVDATLRSLRLGFDVIELHGAHGYLLHQFLSPLSNRRTDEYGGSMEKRRRFPLEVFDAVRKRRAARQGAGHPAQRHRLGRGRPHGRGYDRNRAPAQGAGLRLRRCQLGRQLAGAEDHRDAGLSRAVRRKDQARRPASRPGRSASSPSPSRPNTSLRRARPTARRMPAPSCSTRVGAGMRRGRSASKPRPCHCPRRGPQRSCRSSPSPSWRRRPNRSAMSSVLLAEDEFLIRAVLVDALGERGLRLHRGADRPGGARRAGGRPAAGRGDRRSRPARHAGPQGDRGGGEAPAGHADHPVLGLARRGAGDRGRHGPRLPQAV